MDGVGPQHPLSDPQLDCELDSALDIEPSAEFLARVRARVSEPDRSRWRLGVVDPLWGVAVVGLVLVLLIPRWMREDTRGPSAAPESGRVSSLATNSQVRVPTPRPVLTPSLRSVARRVKASEAPRGSSPVMFSEDERRALATLVTAVEESRVPPLPPATEATNPRGELRELRIDPLVVEPLPQLARLEIGAL